MLEKKGLLVREGTIVDATLLAAPSSTKNESGKRDPEMSSTKKGANYYFGMKAHIGVDSKKGLVHTVEVSTAKNHDRTKFKELLHGEEKSLFGDKGYASDEDKKSARAAGIAWCVMDKGKSKHPLSGKQEKRNHQYASVRAKVEHPFQVLKCQWGFVKVRYRGLAKNAAQLFAMFGLINLFKVRKVLLAGA